MEWKKVKISDVAYIINGGTPKTSIPEYWDGDIPWLSVKDFNTGLKYVSSAEKHITQEGLEHSATNLLEPEDIIISARGTIGVIAMLSRPMAFNQSCFGLRARNFDAHYLYYLLKEKVKELQGQSQGSVFDTIVRATFDRIECVIPATMDDQRRIAAILSSLDDKIENNNRINRNLEEQAQALFKSWFVDFEPFGGVMPDNWKEGTLGEYVTVKRGGSPRPIQAFLSNEGYRWLKISDATAEQSPFICKIVEHIKKEGLDKTVFLEKGNLVLSNSATPGLPKFLELDTCIHDGWLYFPKSYFPKEFLYLLFQREREYLISQGNGSVFTNLKTEIVKKLPVIVPPTDILTKFQNVAQPIFEQIKKNCQESQRLAQLRDTLLPKLMKGEIAL